MKSSVQNTCRQMQTVWDFDLRSMSMFGLISTKLTLYKKWPMVFGRTFPVSSFLLSVTSMHSLNDAKETHILDRFMISFKLGLILGVFNTAVYVKIV